MMSVLLGEGCPWGGWKRTAFGAGGFLACVPDGVG